MVGYRKHQPILHSRGSALLSPFLCVHVAFFFFFLKQLDSIDFLNYIYFICHKGIGQPKVRGGESTTMLSKSNKLNFHVRNIEHWGSVSRSTCVHKRIKLRYNFPNVTWSSCSVYVTRPLHYDHTKRSPIPSSLSHSFPMSGKETELNSLYTQTSSSECWMRCNSNVHSSSASPVCMFMIPPSLIRMYKSICCFFFSLRQWWEFWKTPLQMRKKSKWTFPKKWGGGGRCCS